MEHHAEVLSLIKKTVTTVEAFKFFKDKYHLTDFGVKELLQEEGVSWPPPKSTWHEGERKLYLHNLATTDLAGWGTGEGAVMGAEV